MNKEEGNLFLKGVKEGLRRAMVLAKFHKNELEDSLKAVREELKYIGEMEK